MILFHMPQGAAVIIIPIIVLAMIWGIFEDRRKRKNDKDE